MHTLHNFVQSRYLVCKHQGKSLAQLSWLFEAKSKMNCVKATQYAYISKWEWPDFMPQSINQMIRNSVLNRRQLIYSARSRCCVFPDAKFTVIDFSAEQRCSYSNRASHRKTAAILGMNLTLQNIDTFLPRCSLEKTV